MITIRQEKESEFESVHKINKLAFESDAEADLVDKLRQTSKNFLSLVALTDDKIVGHIFFSEVNIKNDSVAINGMGLGPMAVLPDYQRKGIGSIMVKKGLSELQKQACLFIMVLGHPTYYPKFGFEPASKFGVTCFWDVPDDVFMIRAFDESVLENISGEAVYLKEFYEL